MLNKYGCSYYSLSCDILEGTQNMEHRSKLLFFLSVFCFFEPVSPQNTLASVTLRDSWTKDDLLFVK